MDVYLAAPVASDLLDCGWTTRFSLAAGYQVIDKGFYSYSSLQDECLARA